VRLLDAFHNKAILPGNEVRVTIGPTGVVTLGNLDVPRMSASPVFTPPRAPARPELQAFNEALLQIGSESLSIPVGIDSWIDQHPGEVTRQLERHHMNLVGGGEFVRPQWSSVPVEQFEKTVLLEGIYTTASMPLFDRPVIAYGTRDLMALLEALEVAPTKMIATRATQIKVLQEVAALPRTPPGYTETYSKLKVVQGIDNPVIPYDFLIFMGPDCGTVYHLGEPIPTTRPSPRDVLKVHTGEIRYTYVLDPAQIIGVKLEPARKTSWSHLGEEYL
jgi:hypothetical protein